MNDLFTVCASPIGRLLLVGDGRVITRLHMLDAPGGWRLDPAGRRADDAFATARDQLAEYFAGARRSFELGLDPAGSVFERRVWRALLDIPYGRTASYGEIARRVGAPEAARAVGVANARNPIAVVVPCHRVVGSNGRLTGYGGGLERKRWLLDLEAGVLPLVAA